MKKSSIKVKEKSPIDATHSFPVIGVGASAGGLEAFTKFVSGIPSTSGMAFVLVQHLDPQHDSMLSEIIQKTTTITVKEIVDDLKIAPDHIYIIPNNKILIVDNGRLVLTPRSTNSRERNMVVDIFFSSLAEVYQNQAIGVVLSGAANDGTHGLKAIKEQGGITFAQDEASAAFTGMPHSAILAGVVDFILPPEQIPPKIQDLIEILVPDGKMVQDQEQQDADIYKQILGLLRMRRGTDFTNYKQTTIRRRILRRMALNRLEHPSDYLMFLLGNTPEQDVLYQDLLIPVTYFFRDPSAFEYLCTSVLPRLLKNKQGDETLRLWVAGCSTGEEAYSLAICIKEYMDNVWPLSRTQKDQDWLDGSLKVQIFASDLSEPAIARARIGSYRLSDIDGLSLKRLMENFTKNAGSYVISREIRDMCIFAVHDFLKEPPFGKMDLISCRNVLIYMEPSLQKKAFGIFYYSLNNDGMLFLGKAETASIVPELFEADSFRNKTFTRKNGVTKFMHVVSQFAENEMHQGNKNTRFEIARPDFQKSADDFVLGPHTVAGVVVDEAMEIVYYKGSTAFYLEQPPGIPTHNLLKLARYGLPFELRKLLFKAKKDGVVVTKENLPIQVNGTIRLVSIEAIPLPNTRQPHFLVLFHDENSDVGKTAGNTEEETIISNDEKELRINTLERELALNREDMRIISEDQENANAELQRANEELVSASEELQSLNEELETSKEELQSTNEELIIVNHELVSMNELIAIARDYSQNIIATIREPFLVLDRDLRVKTANASFYKTFQVSEKNTEGVLIYNLGDGQWNIPELRELLENILPQNSRFEDYELKLSFPGIGERTMLLNAREIDTAFGSERLLLLTIADITEHKKAEKLIAETEQQFAFIAESMPQKVWTADAEGKRIYFNRQWADYTGLSLDELKNEGWKQIIHPDDLAATEELWAQSVATGKDFEVEDRKRNKAGQYLWHLSRATAFKDDSGKITMWVGTNTEMEKQKNYSVELEKAVADRTFELIKVNRQLEEKNSELQTMNKELESFTYVSSHDLQEPLRKIQTFAGRILEKENQNLSDYGRDMFQRMQDAGQRMQTLIQDLLAFSRLSTSERKFETTSLNTIVREIIRESKEVIEEKKAVFDVGDLGELKIIPFQFRQLLQNLISNALKFSKVGGSPKISIQSEIAKGLDLDIPSLAQNKKYYHLTVADNGIGFEPEFNEKIFEVFQKLHGKDEYAGTGIGLAIVKKIVENHKGIITAHGELDAGAKFDIYIPV